MSKDNYMELEGIVESFAHDKFLVRVNESYKVLCSLSGKMRQAGIRILAGDQVKIETSVYNTEMGRIVFRIK